tara:strand:- start:2260 stop:3333 length:1074 start_codon:yes stop_codon:yes gene_type:complete
MPNKKKYNVIDLFCGCGGLSLGFKMANFNIIGGVDFEKDCIDTFSLHFKNSKNFYGDISKISDNEIRKTYQDIDVIIGGPPCQGFSAANMWEKDVKKDKRNDLFREFLRFVKILKPKALVLENVSRILTQDKGEIKKEIIRSLEELGYLVSYKILTASDYSVPQKRRRNFFVAISKKNTKFDMGSIKEEEPTILNDALSDLYDMESGLLYDSITTISKSNYQALMRKNSKNKIYNHDPKYPIKRVVDRIKHVKEGGNWKSVPEHLWETIRYNRHSSAYRRLDSKGFSITIDCGHMNYFHPKFDRVPTVRESARIQSFPDDFIFLGAQGSQYRQVGNAVPPLMAKSIAKALKKALNNG